MSRSAKKRESRKAFEPIPLVPKNWSGNRSYAALAALTLICLVPLSGKPFHVDDPLFIWTAQQIVHHPLDPYGFHVVWYTTAMRASEVIKNPPLASYYMAGVGTIAGWSERALHMAFLIPAVIVILGTYYLARRFTRNPSLAAAATLFTPGFLVSSSNVMCDTMMLAAWMLAIIFWLEGMDRMSPLLLAGSALLIAVCALTKYFGMALIPLLLAYSIARKRPLQSWAFYLLTPVAILAAFQYWTAALYGRGLLADAATYVSSQEPRPGDSPLAKSMVGLGFVGGCALTGLVLIPLLWSSRKILLGLAIAGLAGAASALDWITLNFTGEHRNWVCAQLAFFVAGGISILALSITDWWNRKNDPESLLLLLWVVGTFAFAAFVNWTVNARSVLPLIPAVGILLARRLDSMPALFGPRQIWKLAIPLAVAGIVSLWITWGDVQLANSARLAAENVRERTKLAADRVNFQGHWGFQYYMQSFGFHPFDSDSYDYEGGNVLVLPENNSSVVGVPREFILSRQMLAFDVKAGVSTFQTTTGAGFYCDCWGPLPYAFGPVPPELYAVVQTTKHQRSPQ